MITSPARILLLHDDDGASAVLVRERLAGAGLPPYTISEARLEDAALAAAAADPPTLCLLLATGGAGAAALLERAAPLARAGAAVIVVRSTSPDAARAGSTEALALDELTPAVLRTLLRAAAALRESVARRDALIESASDIICLMDEEANFTYVSPSLGRTVGYAPAEILGRNGFDFVHPEDMECVRAAFARLLAHPGAREMVEFRFRARDGVWHRLELFAVNRLHDAPLAAVVLSARDVTTRHDAEEALRASEEQYRTLFDAHPQPMWVYDRETLRFLAVNDSALRHYGYTRDEFLAMTILDIRPPEDRERVRAQAHGRPLHEATTGLRSRHLREDGSLIEVELNKFGISVRGRRAVLVLVEDVTSRLQLEAKLRSTEEQLRLAQRMESIGRLAGGIAHDFNNLLTVIQGNAQILLQDVGPESTIAAELDDIAAAADRAAQLTRQLLAFSRQQVLQPKRLDLNEIILGTRRMLERLIGEDVALEFILAPELGSVYADPGQMEQILLNLAVNARDAMPEGGRLIIETANAAMEPRGEAMYPYARAGEPSVMLRVTDTGVGMDARTRERAFEPFFTTKPPTRGTGLGLSTVYGIVKQSGGYIWVESELGRGTTFTVHLPLLSDAEDVGDEAAPLPVAAIASGGTETILLVEDDASVRAAARRMLGRRGYTVLDAATAEEALHLHAAHGARIQLLVSDVVLPGMSGPDLAMRLTERAPTLRVLYLSGYSDRAAEHGGVHVDPAALLQKPFSADTLTRRVREVLHRDA